MLQLKKPSMDFIFLERIVITPSVEVDDVIGSNMFCPAQCRKRLASELIASNGVIYPQQSDRSGSNG